MQQSILTAPIVKNSPDSSALHTGTGIRSHFSTSLSRINTGIKTVNPSEMKPETPNEPATRFKTGVSPAPNRASEPRKKDNVPAGPGVALNISVKGSTANRNRRNSESIRFNPPIQWTTQGFLSAYEKGKRDFTDQELQGLVLAKCLIPGINCYQSNLSRTNFQNADLTRADFGKAILVQTSLKEANLSDAYFGYANLEGADLRGADLRGANFKFASLRGANFCGVDLTSTHITLEQLALAKTNWRTVMPNGKRGLW